MEVSMQEVAQFKTEYGMHRTKGAKKWYLTNKELINTEKLQKMVKMLACSTGAGAIRVDSEFLPSHGGICSMLNPEEVSARAVPAIKAKKPEEIAFNFVSKDASRPNMNGIFFDDKYNCVVGTNTHRLFVAPSDIPATGAGIYNKQREKIDAIYPNYRRVYPEVTHIGKLVDVETIRKAVYALNDINKMLGVDLSLPNGRKATLKLHIGENVVNFAPDEFLPCLEAMLSLGEKEIFIGFSEKRIGFSPVISFLGKRAYILLMGYTVNTIYSFNASVKEVYPATRDTLTSFY